MTNLSAIKPVTQPVMGGGGRISSQCQWGSVQVGSSSSRSTTFSLDKAEIRKAKKLFLQLLEAWYHDSMDEMDGSGVVMGYDETPY